MTPSAYLDIDPQQLAQMATRARRAKSLTASAPADPTEYSDYSPDPQGYSARSVPVPPRSTPIQSDQPPPGADAYADTTAMLPRLGSPLPGVSRDEAALIQPGPQQSAYEQVAANRPIAKGGFWGHVLGGLKGLGYGGVVGAIEGAASPQRVRDYEYYHRDLPRAYSTAQAERAQQDAQLKAGHAREVETGLNPWTGEPTLPAQQHQESQAWRKYYQGESLANRAQAVDQRGQEFREQAAKNHVAIAQSSGQPVDPNVVKGTTMEPYAGKVLPRAGTDKPEFVGGGRMMWDPVQHKLVPTPGGETLPPLRDPTEVTPAQRFSEDMQNKRFDAQTQREQQKEANLAETKMKQAQNAINAARTLSGKPNIPQDEIDKAWQNAHAAVNETVSSHPDLLEGGPGEGGYPYIQWKGGKKPSFQAPSGNAGGTQQPAPHAVALQLYQTYVKTHPEQKEAARKKFIAQRGIDPEAQ